MPFDAEAWLIDFPPPSDAGPAPVAGMIGAGFAGAGGVPGGANGRATHGGAAPPVQRGARPAANGHHGGHAAGGGGPSRDTLPHRARKYLANKPGGVMGQNGSAAAFDAACTLVKGFGFTPEEAWPLFLEWNQTCVPPFSEAECRHKLSDADAKADDQPRGWIARPQTPVRLGGIPPTGGAAPPDGEEPIYSYEGKPLYPEAGLIGSRIPLEDRPMIAVTPDENEVIWATIAAMSFHPDVFVRHARINEITYTWDAGNGEMADSPKMEIIEVDKLRAMISAVAKLVHYVHNPETEEWEPKPCHVPPWLSKGLYSWKIYPGIRPLEMVTESPIMRRDGTILDVPGYDARTRTYYRPNCDHGPMPEDPTHADAFAAAKHLLGLVDEFPFVFDCHRGAWIANILSVVGRMMFNGPCPVFIYDAAMSQTGKTMLCDLVSVIATGYSHARSVFLDNQEEMRKKVTSFLLGGARSVLLDNIPTETAFGGHIMDALLTGEKWTDRMMMTLKNVEMKISAVFMVTGNNLSIKGDLANRLIPCRIRSDTANPEERKFKIDDIVTYCTTHRTDYLRSALTILRAYHLAGRPEVTTSKIGRFVAWSDVIRSAVVWTLGQDFDPALGQRIYKKEDTTLSNLQGLIHGLMMIPGIKEGVTAAQILKFVDSDTSGSLDTLADALKEWGTAGKLPGSKMIGSKLRSIRHQPIAGHYVTSVCDSHTKVHRWRLMDASEPIPPVESLPRVSSSEATIGMEWGASPNGIYAGALPDDDDRIESTPF